MNKTKSIFTLFVGILIVAAQVGSVFAAPATQDEVLTGTVTALACANEEGSSILVTYEAEEGAVQQIEIDLETAINLGLVTVVDGEPDCSDEAFQAIIDSLSEEEEPKHPVGVVLASFFDEITDYDTIMSAHDDGTGFGVIAQSLWLTNKLEGDSDTFLAIIQAKHDKDFSAFELEDGSTPENWGQFRKAVLSGDKKNNLGVVMSEKDDVKDDKDDAAFENNNKDNNGNKNKDKNKNKKKDKDN